MSRTEFAGQLRDAYRHLYDIVYLRKHPVGDVLLPDTALSRKERSWRLHQLLVDAIDEIDPGRDAPAFSREWRRHRLLVLRYIDGLDPQAVAEELAISRRHYYREHRAAMASVAGVLWERRGPHLATAADADTVAEEPKLVDRIQLLRLEAARLARASRYSRIGETVESVLPLVASIMAEREVSVRLAIPANLSSIAVDRSLVRQSLLAILGYLIGCTQKATLQLAARTDQGGVCIAATVEPPQAVQGWGESPARERLSALEDVSVLGAGHISPLYTDGVMTGLRLHVPVGHERIVLVADDDEDALELFRRCLAPHQYDVVAARTAQEALDLARRLQPYVIVLDLMMPEQDGWDAMQSLLNQPDTQHIPIIVCSILRQKDLALSLGATGFLDKPFTEQALLDAIQALAQPSQPSLPRSLSN